jgi:hypothetical protein
VAQKLGLRQQRGSRNSEDIIASLEDGHPRFQTYGVETSFREPARYITTADIERYFQSQLSEFLPICRRRRCQIANQTEDKRAEIRKEVLEALKGDGVERNSKGEVALHGTHLV